MKLDCFTVLAWILWSSVFVPGGFASPIINPFNVETRSADTCADTSKAVPFIQQFSVEGNAFALNTVVGWAVGVTQVPSPFWSYSGKAFLAWDPLNPDPQGLTTGLWLFFNVNTLDYAVALAQADGTPPSMPGFTAQSLIAFVYRTQVCDSVPLFGAFNAAAGSHYYTTSVNEHTFMLTASGWTDIGVVAYVLPLPDA